MNDSVGFKGTYTFECRDKDGKLKWKDTIENIVTTVGRNFALNQTFGGTQNTTSYLGLISSVGYTGAPVVTDTMTSHTTSGHIWYEAGNGDNHPHWSTPTSNARATITTWDAAASGSKKVTTDAQFIIATAAGTIEGAFLVTGSGASATNNNTSGVLFSAGVFTGGARAVQVDDTVNVSYTIATS